MLMISKNRERERERESGVMLIKHPPKLMRLCRVLWTIRGWWATWFAKLLGVSRIPPRCFKMDRLEPTGNIRNNKWRPSFHAENRLGPDGPLSGSRWRLVISFHANRLYHFSLIDGMFFRPVECWSIVWCGSVDNCWFWLLPHGRTRG